MAFDMGVGVPDEISRLSLGQQEDEPQRNSAPRLDYPGVIAEDITQKFARATKALKPGDIVKDGMFTLFESVGALEIMDPKMDSGCFDPSEEFEELYDVSKPLLPEEVLGIIDQLICFEMAWHMGYPLSQTLFTSVYIEALSMPNPRGIDEAYFVRKSGNEANSQPMLQVLRAYCLGLLKGCLYVNERVKSEHSYEEEDFVTNTYNRTLLSGVSTDDIRSAITDALSLLQDLKESIGETLANALSSRLELRNIFLSAVECPQLIKQPELARRPWTEGKAVLPRINSSHSLAKPVDEAFSAKLQRKLASTIPPRPIVQLSFDDAFGHLERLFRDGEELINVLDFTNPQCLQTFVFFFQAKKPQPLVYIRTLLQTFLFDAMEILGSMSIRQLLDEDLAIISMPASPFLDRANDDVEVPGDPRAQISQATETFRQRAAQPYLDILRTFCQNRCRVRRSLFHVVRAWDGLQADAEELDHDLQNWAATMGDKGLKFSSNTTPADTDAWCLSMWTYNYKLRIMEWIVQLGFELEVYQPDEFAGMYWYLHRLARIRLEYTKRIKTSILKKVEFMRSRKTAEGRMEDELVRSDAYINTSLKNATITTTMSDALSSIYTVLDRLGLVKPPPRPYSNDEMRYEIRMRPFAQVPVPELPSYQYFKTQTAQTETSTEEILEDAALAVANIKKLFESMSKLSAEDSFSQGSHEWWLASVKSALKSCIAMGLAITTLQKAVQRQKDGGELKLKAEIPKPEDAYNSWWIVPRLVPIP